MEIPLNRFVCVTGVSGSGKTTLVREVLLPELARLLNASDAAALKASERFDDEDENGEEAEPIASAEIEGWDGLGRVVLVDQSILGKTPRSNPAVYIGAFEDIREVFAESEVAKQRGLNASAFSFNSAQGQCERCRGAGFEKIEMQFLSDIYVRCPDCEGRRYRSHILEVKIRGGSSAHLSENGTATNGRKMKSSRSRKRTKENNGIREWSIADMLDATVDEGVDFLAAFADSKPARRAADALKLLQEVGLGYLRLGQPINTLSGGESQRLKLVRHLAEAEGRIAADDPVARSRPALFAFDEPTTGLHFDDVRVLLKVFQRLVNAGHSVLVIEHNLDVIRSADWVIDLGPEAGDQGGRIVAQGTPEDIAEVEQSQTGRCLRAHLANAARGTVGAAVAR